MVLGVVGGLGCIALAYVMPAMAYYKINVEKAAKRIFYLLIAGILAIIGIASTVLLITDAVN